MISLKLSGDLGKDSITIDNPGLESDLIFLHRFNYREGDNFTLGELIEILIDEGRTAIKKQIGA